MRPHNFSRTIHTTLLQNFYRNNWPWKVTGRLQFREYPANQCTNMSQNESSWFLTSNSHSSQNCTIWNLVYTLPSQVLWSYEHSHSRKRKPQRKPHHSWSASNNWKSSDLSKVQSGLAFFIKDLRHISGSNVAFEFAVMLRGKALHNPKFAPDLVGLHSLMIYTDLIEYKIVGSTKAPFLRFFSFYFTAGDFLTMVKYMNYETFSSLEFRPLLKRSFQSIHMTWGTRALKK